MCGIAGIFRMRGRGHDDGAAVRAMAARLERRGPDDEGVETDGPATLGNRRLAILDLSGAGHQPMRSRDGRWLLTFNGEIYNFRDLREELGLGPGELSSGTDTEVLLRAWERWGEDALPRLVGQFAFAAYDGREQRLFLARDRFGEKPLFYHHDDRTLAFASTIAALLAAPRVPRSLDPDAIAEYVTLRYVVSPRTVVRDVRKLPGGHLLVADAGGVSVRRWYDPRFRRPSSPRSTDDLVEEFHAHLVRASHRCLESDVPVALLLSDGIDSHSVRAALQSAGHRVPSFTYRMSRTDPGLRRSEEEPDGTDLWVTPRERVDSMEPAFGSFSEPVGDGASLATWLLIRSARPSATVFLCGHGGDEVLGGYRLSQDRFRLALLHRIAWLPQAWVGKALDRFLYGAEPLAERRRAFRRSPARRVPAAARYLIHRPLPVADVRQLSRDGSRYLEVVDRLYEREDDSAGDLDRIQEVMLRTFLSENILSFADSVAMDSSAELRMPYLDRDLVEFVLSLPPGARVSRWPGRANTKQIQRWWGRRHLPDEITRRRKRTFDFGNLPELLRDQGDRLRDWILGPAALRRALPGLEDWLGHPPEYFRGPWEGTLWALLSLGIWSESAGVE